MSNWKYKHAKDYSEIEKFVNSMSPNLDGIQGSLSHGEEFHIWVREGDKSQNTYKLNHFVCDGTSKDIIEGMLEKEIIKIISFNMEHPPKIWFFETI